MAQKILITDKLQGPEFASEERTKAIDRLRDYAEVEFYDETEFGAEHAEGVVGVLADSVVFSPEFYATARDLRIVARWGVGFEKVDVPRATDCGTEIAMRGILRLSGLMTRKALRWGSGVWDASVRRWRSVRVRFWAILDVCWSMISVRILTRSPRSTMPRW